MTEGPVFNQINLVVRDMPAMVAFYERLGVEFTRTLPEWEPHHRTFDAAHMLDGFDFDLDSLAFTPKWDQGWPAGNVGPVFGFRMPSSDAVDATYADLTGAGYAGEQPPWDGFMGARYAVVVDPDGNRVGLMGPIDKSRETIPPLPEG